MRTKVEVAPQVKAFVRSLAPVPRRNLTRAIKALAQDEGDRKALECRLNGYHHLRVSACIFAKRRSVVYELFQQMLLDELTKQ